MKVGELGEFGVIERIARLVGAPPPDVVAGIGDDAAAWRLGRGRRLALATTDTMVEGVHFLSGAVGADLGWKTLAVNISDIAAMGGVPRYALVTLMLPADTEVAAIEALYAGMLEAGAAFDVAIVGGDIVRSPCLAITVAMWGETTGSALLRRSAARVGDVIAVSGGLGASAAGLRLLRDGLPPGVVADTVEALRRAHLRPQPRVAMGQHLIRHGVRVAIDISDGLLADLGHICVMSGVAARLRLTALPLHPAARDAFGDDAVELALSGGEDYELLFTATAARLARVIAASPEPITAIGEIVAGPPGAVAVVDDAGRDVTPGRRGWDHLAP